MSHRFAVVFALLLAAAVAQPQVLYLPGRSAAPEATNLATVEFLPTFVAHGRRGACGWVTVTVENLDVRAHTVELSIGDWSEVAVQRDRIAVDARERVVRHYPVQRWLNNLVPKARVDDLDPVQGSMFAFGGDGIGVLLVGARAATRLAVQELLEPGLGSLGEAVATPRGRATPRPSRTKPFAITDVQPSLLPDRWQCLAGFDLVVLEGGVALGTEQQRVLQEYVAAGGALVALDAGTLADGPLETLVAAGGAGTHGFGVWFGLRGARAADADAAFARWVADASAGLAAARSRGMSGPAPDGAFIGLEIPGLETVPVLAFFVLILLFVFAAGPVNVFLCKRARRPVLLVVTLPALGFSFAAAILLWGMFSEGLGVKGVARSITWLDQRAHFAVSQATQTLYAGVSPDRLQPAPGTLLQCGQVGEENYRRPATHRLAVDGAGTVGGEILPSRLPTTLTGVTAQRSRERLRFKRTREGGYEVLAGPGLVPVAGNVLLRDASGRWFGGSAGDTLVPIDEAQGVARFRAARDAFLSVELMPQGVIRLANVRQGPRRTDEDTTMQAWLLDRLDTLPPGSYLARCASNAAVDRFGLDNVAWLGDDHWVLGLLATEDFVD